MNLILVTTLIGGASGLINVLVYLLILAIVIYVVKLVLDMIPLPAPAKTIVWLILGLVFLVALLHVLGIAI